MATKHEKTLARIWRAKAKKLVTLSKDWRLKPTYRNDLILKAATYKLLASELERK